MSSVARILLVEDDSLVRETLGEVLKDAGYLIHSAENGEEAWLLLQNETFDLVLSDIRMPRMDGFELFNRMQGDPRNTLVPVIYLSALASENDIRQGMALGVSDYLTKPVKPEELCHVVATRLAQKERMDKLLESRQKVVTRYLPHELRTPLNGVMGYAELMTIIASDGRGLTMDETMDFGKQLMTSGRRLLRISDNLMLLLQLGDSAVLFQAEVNGYAWLESLQEEARLVAQDYGREEDLFMDIEVANLHVNCRLIVACMLQLLDNSFRFSIPGQQVQLAGQRFADGYGLRVQDHGRGMTTDQIARCGAFVQHDRDKHEQQGLGIGLEIVRRIVDRLGLSFLLLQNPDGHGLNATVKLPASMTLAPAIS